jgi:pyruvate dehydrogenase E2 component (dihydrolipoamide acetyltransferase)
MGEIFMPKMGDAMTEGKVIRWYKQPGDAVKKGEPVLEIETDKVNLDLEAEEEGVLGEHLVEAGAMADVGAPLATISADGKTAPPKAKKEEVKAAGKNDETKVATPVEEEKRPVEKIAEVAKSEPQTQTGPARVEESGARVKSSPLARKMAQQMGVSLAGINGSGPSGRIVAADISKAASSSSQPSQSRGAAETKAAKAPALPPAAKLEKKSVPLTAMRRTIAKRLSESTGPIPHFFLTADYDVTELLRLRMQFNEIHGQKVSVNDFLIRAVALAIHHHPQVNSSFTEEAIELHGNVHVGVAVATPDGLITPIVRDADRKGVDAIAGEVKSLAEKAKNRKLMPQDYQGSTITISNLGMFGIEEFTAIINPPNTAILAIGAAMQAPVVIDGRVEIRDRMKVTMSCDHRVIDGALGAEYLRTLRQYVEQPLRLVM